MSARWMTPAQMTAEVERAREGRPDITYMTDEQRRAAGLMTLGQAAEHEHLASIPHARLADRSRTPDPDDIWAGKGGQG